MNAGWLAVPRGWLNSIGEIFGFCARVMGLVFSGRVFQFFGEALRQTGILILGSTIVIWGLVFILGLQCGIEGAYFNRSVGAPAYAGVFAAWCDLREVIPYAFGYMLAAKVGTGIVGGIGAEMLYNEPLGGFFATLFNNASTTDLWGSVLKTTLFGAVIAIVCSYKGMTASGGAEGVGRAVNEAVVISFLGIFAINYVFTQTLLATHPELQVIK